MTDSQLSATEFHARILDDPLVKASGKFEVRIYKAYERDPSTQLGIARQKAAELTMWLGAHVGNKMVLEAKDSS